MQKRGRFKRQNERLEKRRRKQTAAAAKQNILHFKATKVFFYDFITHMIYSCNLIADWLSTYRKQVVSIRACAFQVCKLKSAFRHAQV